jgi:hypothetical protein
MASRKDGISFLPDEDDDGAGGEAVLRRSSGDPCCDTDEWLRLDETAACADIVGVDDAWACPDVASANWRCADWGVDGTPELSDTLTRDMASLNIFESGSLDVAVSDDAGCAGGCS